MDVEIRWEGDRLIVDGKDRTPPRPLPGAGAAAESTEEEQP